MSTGTRAAIYCRTSTEDQGAGFSLGSQERELRVFAARKAYVVVDAFRDEITGTTLARPALTALRDGVRGGRFDAVLCHAPDRLARSLALQLVLLDEFKRAGVRVEFVTTPAEDTAEGRLLLNVSGVVAEFEREKIRERTSRGKREKARRGFYVQPKSCPFGYRPDPARPGHLILDEGQAAVVRLIYRLCIDEKRSVRGIVMELRRLGIRSARGRWTAPQVLRVLTGDGYAGVRYFNRHQMQPDGSRRVREQSDWIGISVPAIVAPEQAEAAKNQLAKNKLALVGRPPTAFFLLRALLKCSTCGRRYRGNTSSGYRRYRHQDNEWANSCSAHRVLMADAVETQVRATITAALSDPAALRCGVEAYELRRGARDIELRSAAEYLEKQIAKIRADERRLVGLAVADREQQGIVESKLRELAQRRNGLAAQLRDAEVQVARHGAAPDPERINVVCARARRGLAKLDRDGWRALLAELVDEVRVLPDRRLEIHGLIPHDATPSDAGAKLEQPSRRA
jgi:site-specific DNA recombinase